MPRAPPKVSESISRCLVPQRSASHRIAAPTHSISATRAGSRTHDSMVSVKMGPTMTAGIVATTMSQAILRSLSPLNERSRMVARPAGISLTQSRQK